MELMSSLLLYALAATLPQALGFSSRRQKLNSSLVKIQDVTAHKKILLMAPRLLNSPTGLESVFRDVACTNCLDCMERAIKAHKTHEHMLYRKPQLEELYYDVLNESHHMSKRRTNDTKPETKTKNQSKGKSKSVTVTKYSNVDGKIYALKVKESITKNDTDKNKNTCKIYSVVQSLPCDTFGSDVILEKPKKKVKREKKTKHRPTTEKTITLPTSYKKRDVDNSEIPENFMISIEDMY